MKYKSNEFFVFAFHFLGSFGLFWIEWDYISRHLGKYTNPFILGYAFFSIILFIIFFGKRLKFSTTKKIILAASIPYFSSSLSYIMILIIYYSINNNVNYIFASILIALIGPYILIKAYLISLINSVVLYILILFSKRCSHEH